MKFKGTPGPWRSKQDYGHSNPAGGVITDGDGLVLALALGRGIGAEKATANAVLMAAAPEIIDFLTEINGAYYLSDKHQAELYRLIKLAGGEI